MSPQASDNEDDEVDSDFDRPEDEDEQDVNMEEEEDFEKVTFNKYSRKNLQYF